MSRKCNHDKTKQKFKEMTEIHQNKIELDKYIEINKHCKVCKDRNVYETSHAITRLNNFRRVRSHKLKKRIIVF